jgi:hypothetical protein
MRFVVLPDQVYFHFMAVFIFKCLFILVEYESNFSYEISQNFVSRNFVSTLILRYN